MVRHLGHRPDWAETRNIFSCTLNMAIIEGISLSAWHMRIDVDSISNTPTKANSAWLKVVQHNSTLDKSQAHKSVKSTPERVLATPTPPKFEGAPVQCYVERTCPRRTVHQVKVKTVVIDFCTKYSAVAREVSHCEDIRSSPPKHQQTEASPRIPGGGQ